MFIWRGARTAESACSSSCHERPVGEAVWPAGLEKFKADYNKLIDGILTLNKDTRFVLLSPIRHEKLPPPPDPARHNEILLAAA